MTSRQRKAMLAYVTRTYIPIGDDTWIVQLRRNKAGKRPSPYIIRREDDGMLTCSCPGYQEIQGCKHVSGLEKTLLEGPPSVPYEHVDEDRRPTYPQDNVRYRMGRKVMMTALPLVIRALARNVYPVKGSR